MFKVEWKPLCGRPLMCIRKIKHLHGIGFRIYCKKAILRKIATRLIQYPLRGLTSIFAFREAVCFTTKNIFNHQQTQTEQDMENMRRQRQKKAQSMHQASVIAREGERLQNMRLANSQEAINRGFLYILLSLVLWWYFLGSSKNYFIDFKNNIMCRRLYARV